MRVQPKALISFLLFFGYLAIVAIIWQVNDVDYETVGDTTTTVLKSIVVPVGVGAVFLALAATWLGWWRPAMREEHRAGPQWGVALPILVLIYTLIGISTIDFGSAEYRKVLPVLLLGTLLVGFSEELLTRGLMLVGFRGSVSEVWVWFLTSVMFGLVHALNVFFGQSLSSTLTQIGFAFVLGSAFYVIRRTTGLLIVTMVLHALWDFGTIGTEASGGSGTFLGALVLYPAVIIAVILLVKILRAPAADRVVPAT